MIDAHSTAQAIGQTAPASLEGTGTALLEVDGRHVGELVSMPEASLSRKQWAGVQFARAGVLRSAWRLLNEGTVAVPGETSSAQVVLCQVDELGQVGPDRRRIVDGFDRTNAVTEYPFIEDHDTEKRRSMLVLAPDSYLAPLVQPKGGQRTGYGDHLWQQAGQLLIAERLWLNTTRIIAMHTGRPVLSNVWWPVKTDNRDWDVALALWLNSSLGILTLLARRTSTRGGWVALKKAELAEMPVLDVRALPEEQLQALSALFDELADAEFMRLPEMAECPARRALDDGLSRILNLPDLSALRRMLATEPVVSNRRL